jgi:hypothetical protein
MIRSSPQTATAAQQQQQQQQQHDAVYFQIIEAQPQNPDAQQEPLAVNPAVTQLVLQGGSCKVLLPAGFSGYAAAAAATAAFDDATTTPSSSSSSSSNNRARQCQEQWLLGVHASAALHAAPGLPGVSGPLNNTWRSVANVLVPLLHPESACIELHVSLLLWGPRGSGRRTAARAAAAALGLQVIELSCYDLKVCVTSLLLLCCCWILAEHVQLFELHNPQVYRVVGCTHCACASPFDSY